MRGRGYYFARWCCYCHMQRCCHEAVLCPRCNAGRASYDASRLGRSLMSFLVGARAGYSWTVPSAMPGLLYRRRYSPPAVTGSPPLRRAVGHSHGPGLGLAHGQPVRRPPTGTPSPAPPARVRRRAPAPPRLRQRHGRADRHAQPHGQPHAQRHAAYPHPHAQPQPQREGMRGVGAGGW